MLVSQKSRYALRAVFELALRHGQGPVKVADIAAAQAIPLRFLEVILGQLKQAGFVESRRGNVGGYLLARFPDRITVGEVLEFIQGPVNLLDCTDGYSKGKCPLLGNCVFLPMWEKVQDAISGIYDNTTFENLVEQQKKMDNGRYTHCYSI